LEWLRLGPGRDGWSVSDKLDVTVHGNPDAPLLMRATKEDASDADLGSTLMVLEESGFIQRTPFMSYLGDSSDVEPSNGKHT
jgi:hypothetical protein